MTRLLAFSGSSRKDSLNSKLSVRLASVAEMAGVEINWLSLADYPLAIYNGDLEADQGLPENAKKLKALMSASDGFIITCPEYNGFMTPLLINTIAWCSRSESASVDLSPFSKKTVFIASASPGPGGGGRAATHLRTMLSGIGAYVSPHSLSVPSAFGAFNDSGEFEDETMQKRAVRLVGEFIEFTQKLK